MTRFSSVLNCSGLPSWNRSGVDRLVVLDDAPLAGRRRKMVELGRATREIAAPHDLLVTSAADFERNSTRPGTTE
jgi:hypothetical protein